MKNVGIRLQHVQLLDCKKFNYKPLKMDAESPQNVDFKNQKMEWEGVKIQFFGRTHRP